MTDVPDPLGLPGPFSDPQLDGFEQDIEQRRAFHDPLADPDGPIMDALGVLFGQAEAATECQQTVPPAQEYEPLLEPGPEAGPALTHGPTSQRPPQPAEHPPHYRGDLQAADAAKPFVTREGLAPPSHRSHIGGSTGIRNQGASGSETWCPRAGRHVDIEEVCRSCEWYEADAAGGGCSYGIPLNWEEAE